jgi:hypothetical protein
MTLHWNNIALISYDNGKLEIHALNPEVRVGWVMSRMEMFGLGLSCIWAAIRSRAADRSEK